MLTPEQLVRRLCPGRTRSTIITYENGHLVDASKIAGREIGFEKRMILLRVLSFPTVAKKVAVCLS